MKKSLLLAALLMAGSSAFAAVEAPDTYAPKDGYTLTNIWSHSNRLPENAWLQLVNDGTFASPDFQRSAIMVGDYVYVASSKISEGDALAEKGRIHVFSAADGSYVKSVDLTVDGAPLEGTLCANHILSDDYGHLLICGFKGAMYIAESNAQNPLKVYQVNPETGACTLAAKVGLPEDEYGASGRVDFIDVVGDITRAEARCVIMAAPSGSDVKYVYGWVAEQGGDFGPLMSDGSYYSLAIEQSYPEGEGAWGGGAAVSIVRDEEFSASQYYIDAFNYCPAIYDLDGGMLGSFADLMPLNANAVPQPSPNGITEFAFGDEIFILYAVEEYEKERNEVPCACRSILAKYGEPGNFATINPLYEYPANGLGTEKGAGSRFHVNQVVKIEEKDGKHGCYFLTFKSGNGMAYYLFAEEGFGGVNDAVVEDVNAPVQYFNLQGIEVAEPANGLYIRRQGGNVTKVIL